jgi:hypothetical protein
MRDLTDGKLPAVAGTADLLTSPEDLRTWLLLL